MRRLDDLGQHSGLPRSTMPSTMPTVNALRLFGRDAELTTLTLALDAVSSDSTGGLVLLVGESGAGKTVLVDTLLARAQDRGLRVARATCEAFSAGMSFFPIRELMRYVSQPESVQELVARGYGESSNEALVANRAFDDQGEPASRREYLIATFANAVIARAKVDDKPVVVFVDDLERIDPASVDALTVLASRILEGPILLVGALRSDVVAADTSNPARMLLERARRGRSKDSVVEVGPLPQDLMREMVEGMLDGPVDVSSEFLRRLYAETEGNPLFVREVIRALQEPQHDGTVAPIRQVDGRWILQPTAAVWEIPDSIEDAVETRLNPLDDEQIAIVESAAVVGRRFPYETLQALTGVREDDLLDHLDVLVKRDVMRESRGDDWLAFAHGKIRDVAYARITSLRRTRLHRQVAQVVAEQRSIFPEDQWNVLMGHHLFAARRYEEAAPHLVAAGHHALRLLAAHDAAAQFRRAIESLERSENTDLAHVAEVRLLLGESLKLSGQLRGAVRELERVRDGSSDSAARWALNHLGDIGRLREDDDSAVTIYEECEAAAIDADDSELMVETFADLAELHMRQAERFAGIDAHKAARHSEKYAHYLELETELAKNSPSSEAKARAFRNAAKFRRTAGDVEGAVELYRESLAHMDEGVSSHQFLIPYAKALRLADRRDGALQVVRDVLDWSRQIGATRSEGIARQYYGLLLFEAVLAGDSPDVAEAREQMTKAIALHEEVAFGQGLRETAMDLFELELWSGDIDAARERLSQTDAARLASPALSRLDIARAATAQVRANGEPDRAARIERLLDRHPDL